MSTTVKRFDDSDGLWVTVSDGAPLPEYPGRCTRVYEDPVGTRRFVKVFDGCPAVEHECAGSA